MTLSEKVKEILKGLAIDTGCVWQEDELSHLKVTREFDEAHQAIMKVFKEAVPDLRRRLVVQLRINLRK